MSTTSNDTISINNTTNTVLHINMSKVTKLTSTNYLMWSLQIHALLDGYALAGHLDESTEIPSATLTNGDLVTENAAFVHWKRQDKLIYSALIGAISTPIQPMLSRTTTASEIWEKLKARYAIPTRGHIQQLKAQIKSIGKVRLRLETRENDHNNMRLKADELESNYEAELIIRIESEIALEKEGKELEAMTKELETCKIEQENLASQVRTWQDKYDQESSLRKETEDALSREKQELEIVKGLLESYNQAADLMREERDNFLETVQELTRKQLEDRQPPASFFCPITQEVMKDPHFAADGFTYEAEAIKRWLSTGHDTSPMTNLRLTHRTVIPNRALRSAIQDLV